MGLDGGTVISRTDVLRGASWDLAQADASTSTRGGQLSSHRRHGASRALPPSVVRETRWRVCALSGAPLSPARGVVACALGRLYDRETALTHVLTRHGVFTSEEATYAYANRLNSSGAIGDASHLRARSDFFEVRLARAADATEETPEFECPATGARCGRSAVAFVALRPCGHVVSEKAAREAAKAAAVRGGGGGGGESESPPTPPTCPACEVPFDPAHSLPIHGTEAQVEKLRDAMDRRHAAEDDAKARRKGRREAKRRKQTTESESACG